MEPAQRIGARPVVIATPIMETTMKLMTIAMLAALTATPAAAAADSYPETNTTGGHRCT
jgi:hypothetical protein